MDNEQDLLTEGFGADGIFLRAADHRRFDYVMRAIREDGQSLALSSNNEDVLDHYARLVINKLRQIPDLQIEVFLPTDTDALLERFNQILAGLSLTDARNGESSPAPRRVLIAHDTKAVKARDLQLIARLIQDFPGANTALVLLLDGVASRQHERTLENFGQRMLRWPVEAPTRSEGEALLRVARERGFEVEVRKLLAATGTVPDPDNEAVPMERPMFAKELAAVRQQNLASDSPRTEPTLDEPASYTPKRMVVEKTRKEKVPETKPAKPASPKRSSRWRAGLNWLLAIVLLIVVSGGVIAALFPQRLFPVITSSSFLKQTLPPWMMQMVVRTIGTPPPPPVPEQLKPDPEPVQPATEDKQTLAPASDSAPAADTSIKQNPLAAADKPADKAADKVVIAPAAEPALAKTVTEKEIKANTSKPVAAVEPVAKVGQTVAVPSASSDQTAQDTVAKAALGSYFVQHVSMASLAEAQAWRAQYPVLKNSLIAAVKTQEQGIRFAVFSGPFTGRKEAEAFTASKGVPADTWLRPQKSLQKALQNAAR